MHSPDQQEALERCLATLAQREEARLVGPAGSGKTYLMRSLLQEAKGLGWDDVLACPTGRAARRLAQSTGRPAQTCHRMMYSRVEQRVDGSPMFVDTRQPPGDEALIVVDEASMLGKKLYTKLCAWKRRRTRILFVGDREQLEPVDDVWGPDLKQPTAALTTIHRQALESPIIRLATAVREGRGDPWIRDWNRQVRPDSAIAFGHGIDHAVSWYLNQRDSADVALITYTHEVRRAISRVVKARRQAYNIIDVGDRLLVRVNAASLDLMNGDVLTVTHVEQADSYRTDWLRVDVAERNEPILVNLTLFEQPPSAFWAWRAQQDDVIRSLPFVHVWSGEALTVHLAQGSQWDNVGFVWCRHFTRMRRREPDQARRFLYTAVTRAAKNLGIFAT